MYYIVANPNSKRGKTMFSLPALTALFDGAGIPYDTHITTGPKDGYEKTLKFCQSRHDLKGVIGMGDDAVIQEIVAGMAAAFPEPNRSKIPVPLGILPSVTDNDFVSSVEGSKHLAKIKYGKNINDVCRDLFEAVVDRRLRAVDLVAVNGMVFLNIGCIGLDAEVAKRSSELKHKFDDKAYLATVYKTIAGYKSLELTIETTTGAQSVKQEGKYTLVAVANGQYYGNGMRIVPEAKIDDGKITLCLVQGMNRLRTMLLFPTVLLERHRLLKTFSFTECDRVKITLPPGHEYMCLDGNIYPCGSETEFKILPQALNLFV